MSEIEINTKPIDEVIILLAEDDDGHAELIKQHLQAVGLYNQLIRFNDGQEILDFLEDKNSTVKRIPDQAYLLLLDIRMPKLDGVEVLKKIRAKVEFKNLPIIMLTTTDDPHEIEQCYKLGCNSYVTKPVDFYQFAETLKKLGNFIMVIKVAKV